VREGKGDQRVERRVRRDPHWVDGGEGHERVHEWVWLWCWLCWSSHARRVVGVREGRVATRRDQVARQLSRSRSLSLHTLERCTCTSESLPSAPCPTLATPPTRQPTRPHRRLPSPPPRPSRLVTLSSRPQAPPAKRRRTLDPPPPSPAPAPAPPPRRPHSPFALSLAGPFAAHSLALASDFAPAVDAASALGALPAAAEQPHSVEPAPPLLPALGGALVASGVDSLSVLAHEEDRGINALGPDDDELTRENERAALEELEHVKNGASSSLSLSLGPPECKS